MNHEQAKALLSALGSKYDSTNKKWVRGSCPLAPFRHRSGKDSHPSFGIYVSPDTAAHFHCFACESGDLTTLFQLIEFGRQNNPGLFTGNLDTARAIVEAEQLEVQPLPEYLEFAPAVNKQFQEQPEWWLSQFPLALHSDRARYYLARRDFLPVSVMVEHWKFRYDPERDMLLFPYWNVHGQLAGIRGRAIEIPGEPPPKVKHHDYTLLNVNNGGITWFNEPVLQNTGPVVVVEGPFDCMRVHEVYPVVVANFTAKPVAEKLQKLVYAEGVILMLDGDDTGREATVKFERALHKLGVSTLTILLPWDGKTKTDPDSLGVGWVQKALSEIGLI